MKITRLKAFHVTSTVFWLSLAGAFLAVTGYSYMHYNVTKIGEGNAILTEETKVLEAQQSEVGQLKRDLTANQTRQPVLVSYFIDATDIVPFLETVEGYGRDTGVSVKFDTVDIKHAPNRLAVVLTSVGSFTDLYRFIALVEAAPYEITITSANVKSLAALAASSSNSTTQITGDWQARIILSVFSITGVTNAPANARSDK